MTEAAIIHLKYDTNITRAYHRIDERRGKQVARVAALITSLSFYLYLARRFRVYLSDGKSIANDGKGPYEDGVDGVQIYSSKIGFYTDILDAFVIQTGSRSVLIDFWNTRWVNESMKDMLPRFASRHYSADFFIGALPYRMDVGERQSPIIMINLRDPDAMLYVANFPGSYEQNHVDLVRESEGEWTLDVDAWFEIYDLPITQWPPPLTYYVRMSFKMTIHAVPPFKFIG